MGGKRAAEGRKGPGDDWRGFLRALGNVLPIPLTIFGAVVAVATAISMPPDVGALQSDTRLRADGNVVAGVITTVDVEHHTGRRSSYDVYTPTVAFSLRGERRTVELDRYAVVDDVDAYRERQDVTVMVGPSGSGSGSDEPDVGIRSDASRAELVGSVRNDVVLAAIGLPSLVAGIVIPFVRRSRRRRSRRRR